MAIFWLVASKGGIYGQMGEITVLISHALSLKVSSNNKSWALYQSNSQLQLKSKFKLYHKTPIQCQTQAYLKAFRILHTITANRSLMKIKLYFTFAILSLNITSGSISNPTIPPTPSSVLQPIFHLLCICNCSPILL